MQTKIHAVLMPSAYCTSRPLESMDSRNREMTLSTAEKSLWARRSAPVELVSKLFRSWAALQVDLPPPLWQRTYACLRLYFPKI